MIRCTTVQQPNSPTNPSSPTPTLNGDADVEFVRIVQTSADTYTFYVTVRHADTGWDDYADGWDVVLPDGTIVQTDNSDTSFTRLLLHPHELEQPFTRQPRWACDFGRNQHS